MLRDLLPYIAVLPATAYSLISLWCGRSFFRQGRGTGNPGPENSLNIDSSLSPVPNPQSPVPAVTILKPIKGMDAGSYDNFASFCRQHHDAPLQIVFAVASGEDPAVPVVRHLMADFPAIDISLIVNPAIHGPNYKVCNLINAFPHAKYDIIIVCDSDIRVSPAYLSSVLSHFADPAVGLVTSLYRTSSVANCATAVEATGFTTEMIPNVLVALQLEGLSFALGASMAVRREALAAIGGFEALVNYLADDYQLGNKVHHAGWRIALDDCFVESMMHAENLGGVLSRQLRWARTMRVSRPGGYLASGITLPFPALILAVLMAPSAMSALCAALILYGTRLTVSTIFSRDFVKDRLLPRWLWMIPLRDLTAFCTWALSFLGNHVTWRGSRFLLHPGGTIEEISH